MKLNDIKSLYDMGFALLWLYPKSKRPIGLDWTEGPRKFWETLQKTHKDVNNVGVRLGSPSQFEDGSYLCVLDCDVKSSDPIHLKEMEKALADFCPSNEFAPRVLSGRGGGSCHFYFRTKEPQQSFKAMSSAHKVKVYMPSAEPSKVDSAALTEAEIKSGYRMRLAWEVDVFGEGKQVVLPPSVHPDTMRAYQWEQPLRDYEAIPLVKNFVPKKIRLLNKSNKEVKFEDVDLFSTPINEKYYDLITSGKGFEGYPSRSEALFASLNALIFAGLSDGQIYSVLTDADNFMSEKPLQSGKGDLKASARWLQTQIDKIRSELDASKHFENEAIVDDLDEMLALSDEEAQAQLDELVPWHHHLDGKEGKWKNTANNLYLILKNVHKDEPSPDILFSYDEFNQANVYSFAPPWGSGHDIGRELTDLDDIRIKTWLSQEWGIEASTQSIFDVTHQLGKENSFHPVRRYIKSLKWDGVHRLDSFLADYCGATGKAEYLADVGRKTLVAAIARIFQPGIKYDYVTILEGVQGIRKSTFVKELATPWYSDSLGDISSKDVVDSMRGKWIIELGELSSLNKAESNELKAFVTRETDVVRKAYGRRAQSYPRQCIFIGTTNDEEYLKDATGGRRFWPVRTFKYNIAKLKKHRDQLWAEAYACYQLGEDLYLENESVRKYAEEQQAARYVVDEIQSSVKEIINSEDFNQDAFTFDDVWNKLAISSGGTKLADLPMQARIKKCFRVLGYTKSRPRTESGRAYVWRKTT